TAGTAGTDHVTTTPAHIKVADPLTNEGLTTILAYLEECGWADQEIIDRLLIAIEARTRSRLAFLIKHNSPLGFREVLADVCARVWEIIRTQTRDVIGAEFGWAYVLRAAARQYEKTNRASTFELPTGDETRFDAADESSAGAVGNYEHGFDQVLVEDITGWNAGIQFLIGELVARGVDQGLAWHATRRMLEICTRWGFHARITKAREDAELARLGLSPRVIGAWMGLLSGARRAGEEGSFLLGFARGRRTFTEREEYRLQRIVNGTCHLGSGVSSPNESGLGVAS
ncbi:hypothetical protein, partial [Actinotignum sanguinis]